MKRNKNRHSNAVAHLALIKKGIAEQQEGNLKAAEYCFQKVLRQNPQDGEALNQLGILVLVADAFEMSVGFLERAVKSAPKNADFRSNLANSYILSGQHKKAMPHLLKALALNPRLLAALMNMGIVYRSMENGEDAEKIYRRAVLFHGESLDARNALADTLADLGKNDEAFEIFSGVLVRDPENIEAISGIANSKTHGESSRKCLEKFDALLRFSKINEDLKLQLHFASGKICNDLEMWNVAFDHYARANAHAKYEFSMTRMQHFRRVQKKLFTPAFYALRQNFGDMSNRPVFVVGMPRSGTTLVEQILDSHPKIKGAGEMPDLTTIIHEYLGPQGNDPNVYDAKFKQLTDDSSKALARKYLAALDGHSKTALRVVDKLPHNFEVLGIIALMFPNAQVIHCRRDPMDNCVSCFMNQFNDKHDYVTNLTMLGEYYRAYDGLMKHWKNVLPISLIDIQYEEMVARQEEKSRELVAFLGLDWDDRCLDFHKTDRMISTPSRNQVRQPIYTSSVKRWKHYENHLDKLKSALGDLFVG